MPEVRFKHFRSSFSTWDSLMQQAAGFASSLGPRRLISISHSADQGDGVVVVWYWSAEPR